MLNLTQKAVLEAITKHKNRVSYYVPDINKRFLLVKKLKKLQI